MINRTLQTGEEPSRRCLNVTCTGSISSRKHFVAGFDQIMFSIDRIRWIGFGMHRKNMDTARVERSFEIPLIHLMVAEILIVLFWLSIRLPWYNLMGQLNLGMDIFLSTRGSKIKME